MPQVPDDPQFLDDDHAAIVTFAETYFDDDEERETFIDTLMERRGYQRVSSWGPAAPPEPEQRQAPRQQRAPRQQPAAQPAQAARRGGYFKR